VYCESIIKLILNYINKNITNRLHDQFIYLILPPSRFRCRNAIFAKTQHRSPNQFPAHPPRTLLPGDDPTTSSLLLTAPLPPPSHALFLARDVGVLSFSLVAGAVSFYFIGVSTSSCTHRRGAKNWDFSPGGGGDGTAEIKWCWCLAEILLRWRCSNRVLVLHPPELELKMGILLGGGGTTEIQSRLLVEELQSPAVVVLLVAAAELQWRGSGGAPIGG
jgi:hypothetical protein